MADTADAAQKKPDQAKRPASATQTPDEDERLLVAAEELPKGKVLRDRYETLEPIGRGGMSIVYSALDRRRLRARAADPVVALKVANTKGPLAEDAVELLYREARRAHALAHPNLVRVFDWDCEDDTHFIVMERLDGQTIGRRLKRQDFAPFDRATVAGIVRGAAAGLNHLHQRGLVFGDVKPGNIFLTGEGRIKLIDFGLAHGYADGRADDDDPTALHVARLGALTPAYAAIDMLRGDPPTPADDVYALAVTAYVLLTGQHPFGRKTALEAQADGLTVSRPDGLSRGQWYAIRSGLALERVDRIADIDRFARGFLRTRSWNVNRS